MKIDFALLGSACYQAQVEMMRAELLREGGQENEALECKEKALRLVRDVLEKDGLSLVGTAELIRLISERDRLRGGG